MPARVGAMLADRVRRPRHAAGGDRPLRRDRVLGGAAHARDRRAHGAWRQARRRAVDGDAAGLRDRRDRTRAPARCSPPPRRRRCGGLLYGITPFDPIAWGLALTAMIAAAALANFVPARRAMRVDPMTALRTE